MTIWQKLRCKTCLHILPSPPRYTVEENVRRKEEKSFYTFKFAFPIYKQPAMRQIPFMLIP